MKIFLALCFVAVVICVNGHKCGSLDCTDDQCCLRPMFGSYRCQKLAGNGEPCDNGSMMPMHCGCAEGFVCQRRMWQQSVCVKSDETTTTTVTVATDVPQTETPVTDEPPTTTTAAPASQ